MEKQSKALNAGVQNITGVNTQENFALYILLHNFSDFKNRKFSIYMEHHDDFLFCFKDENDLVSLVDAYQSKKASGKWELNDKFIEIIKKILEVGVNIEADEIDKSPSFLHKLNFITNESIHLKIKGKSGSNIINEARKKVKYIELDSDIQGKIQTDLLSLHKINNEEQKQLDKISLLYVDFSKTKSEQQNQLIGLISSVFEHNIHSPKAALDTLLTLFNNIEAIYNEGSRAELLDKKKSIESDLIFEAFDIISNKKKAYEYWRDKKNIIAEKLLIPVPLQKNFCLDFESSFDLFKDIYQIEHNKIKKFVFDNKLLLNNYFNEIDCITELYNKFINEEQTQLTELQLKAVIYASYFILIDTYDE